MRAPSAKAYATAATSRRVDALDMRLLRRMGTMPFAHSARSLSSLKPAQLAQALGTTRQTVEARLARLQEEGVLQGYALWPNLHHLALHWTIYHWKVQDAARKSASFESLPLEGGIVGIYSFLGPDLCVDVQWRSEAERDAAIDRVTAATGGASPSALFVRDPPPVDKPLSALDWRIIQALRHDARRPLDEVATLAGVSLRTVKRRLAAMERGRAFDVTARVSLARSPHPIPLAFLFHFTPNGGRATADALLRLFDDRCIEAGVPASAELGNWDMSLYARSPAEIDALRAQAEEVPGVARVDVLLYTGMRVDERWLDDEIARQIVADDG